MWGAHGRNQVGAAPVLLLAPTCGAQVQVGPRGQMGAPLCSALQGKLTGLEGPMRCCGAVASGRGPGTQSPRVGGHSPPGRDAPLPRCQVHLRAGRRGFKVGLAESWGRTPGVMSLPSQQLLRHLSSVASVPFFPPFVPAHTLPCLEGLPAGRRVPARPATEPHPGHAVQASHRGRS